MTEPAKNEWLNSYSKIISKLLYDIEKYDQMGSYGGNLDLQGIKKIIIDACSEVRSEHRKLLLLEGELTDRSIAYAKLEEEYKELQGRFEDLKKKKGR
ncbi:MAG: hypothetical protein PVG65_01175 [Candidatus Thorarchaeota archaeon]|jgi:hypothetical protein